MKAKKTERVDLEKKRIIFFELALVIVLSLVLIAFEWTNTNFHMDAFELDEGTKIDEEQIQITIREEPKTEKKELPQIVQELEIIDNDIDLDEELVLEDMEVGEDMLIEAAFYPDNEEETVDEIGFFLVEDKPSFMGEGLDGFVNYVSRNLKYPEIAAESGISGRVFIRFVIDVDGSITGIELLRGVDPSLDEEALRVVRNAPKWTPGKQRGKPVKVGCQIPIAFKLQ